MSITLFITKFRQTTRVHTYVFNLLCMRVCDVWNIIKGFQNKRLVITLHLITR
jgi:hypothetical protein